MATWNQTIPPGACEDILATLEALEVPDVESGILGYVHVLQEATTFLGGSGLCGDATDICQGSIAFDSEARAFTITLAMAP